jgi:hypothetical protein
LQDGLLQSVASGSQASRFVPAMQGLDERGGGIGQVSHFGRRHFSAADGVPQFID